MPRDFSGGLAPISPSARRSSSSSITSRSAHAAIFVGFRLANWSHSVVDRYFPP